VTVKEIENKIWIVKTVLEWIDPETVVSQGDKLEKIVDSTMARFLYVLQRRRNQDKLRSDMDLLSTTFLKKSFHCDANLLTTFPTPSLQEVFPISAPLSPSSLQEGCCKLFHGRWATINYRR